MAAYVKLFRSIWQDDDFKALAAEDQRAYLMLISQSDLSHVGVLPLMPSRWARLAPDTDADSVRASLTHLAVDNFIVVDESTEEVLVRSYLIHDEAFKLTNGKKSLLAAYERVLSRPLRQVIETLLLRVGVTVVPTLDGTVDVSQQQQQQPAAITSSHEPAAAADPTWAAAAAISMLIDYRCVTESPRFPGPWRAALAKALPDEHGDAIRRFQTAHPNATAADIAGRVLGVPGLGNTTIPPAPDWHANPHCEHCDGSGIARLDDIGQGTYGPCECRRTEPYPDADVIEIRWA